MMWVSAERSYSCHSEVDCFPITVFLGVFFFFFLNTNNLPTVTTFYIKVCHVFISLVTFNKFLLSQVIAAVALSSTSLYFVSSKCSRSCYQGTKSDVLGLGAFPVLENLTLWLLLFQKKKKPSSQSSLL